MLNKFYLKERKVLVIKYKSIIKDSNYIIIGNVMVSMVGCKCG